MATNYVQPGDTLTLTAPGAITSGSIVQIGALIGVAAGDAASGEGLDLVTVGCFMLPKVSTDAVIVGDVLYFDAANGVVTTEDGTGANDRIGVAVTAAANPSASVVVRLDG
ncbi:Predicted phage recombinase, RecA/RadA family [Roseivivax lentus]|uniref:Predicted phage recombinase, RecA/RadA family n=1 Tax=Roseivivax lentus TaxID=633194 RepID=A0A1N7PIW8_9RHOB|nr:capsid cement protein [Roseivivax lentus]SIT10430.1 Predicted phage recombinase, RecA/RadA family [Roseivivax lentus]